MSVSTSAAGSSSYLPLQRQQGGFSNSTALLHKNKSRKKSALIKSSVATPSRMKVRTLDGKFKKTKGGKRHPSDNKRNTAAGPAPHKGVEPPPSQIRARKRARVSDSSSDEVPLSVVRQRRTDGKAQKATAASDDAGFTPPSPVRRITPFIMETRSQKRKLQDSSPERRVPQATVGPPLYSTDSLAEMSESDFEHLPYPIQIPVPHEPHTFRLVQDSQEILHHAEVARSIRAARLHNSRPTPSATAIPSTQPIPTANSTSEPLSDQQLSAGKRNNPMEAMLAQIEKHFLDGVLFLQGAARHGRRRRLTGSEMAAVGALSDNFVKGFRDARNEFEEGCRRLGMLRPADAGTDGQLRAAWCGKGAVSDGEVAEGSPVQSVEKSPSTIIDLQDLGISDDE